MLEHMHHRRLSRFVIVGVGANILLYVLVFVLHRAGVPAFPAGMAGYAIAFVAAYLAQHGWTFGGEHSHASAFPRYLAAQLSCAVLSGLAGHLSVAAFSAPTWAMSAAVTAIAGISSYFLSSRWVFPALRNNAPTADLR